MIYRKRYDILAKANVVDPFGVAQHDGLLADHCAERATGKNIINDQARPQGRDHKGIINGG